MQVFPPRHEHHSEGKQQIICIFWNDFRSQNGQIGHEWKCARLIGERPHETRKKPQKHTNLFDLHHISVRVWCWRRMVAGRWSGGMDARREMGGGVLGEVCGEEAERLALVGGQG